MGEGSWAAMLGGAVIGGLILVSYIRFNVDMSQEAMRDTLEHSTYTQLTAVTDILEADIAAAGRGIGDPLAQRILIAAPGQLRFRGDIDNDGHIETVTYTVGDTAQAAATDNPRDRLLTRSIDSAAPEHFLSGITGMQFSYFDANGHAANQLKTIRTVGINMTIESAIALQAQTPRLVWSRRISPLNLGAQ